MAFPGPGRSSRPAGLVARATFAGLGWNPAWEVQWRRRRGASVRSPGAQLGAHASDCRTPCAPWHRSTGFIGCSHDGGREFWRVAGIKIVEVSAVRAVGGSGGWTPRRAMTSPTERLARAGTKGTGSRERAGIGEVAGSNAAAPARVGTCWGEAWGPCDCGGLGPWGQGLPCSLSRPCLCLARDG